MGNVLLAKPALWFPERDGALWFYVSRLSFPPFPR